MKHPYALGLLLTTTLSSFLLLVNTAWGQPIITTVSPAANARAAARTSPITVSFSQALTASSAMALRVYSAQRGGLRTRGTTPAVVSGNILNFTPASYRFMPGEVLFSTVTTAAASSGGNLAKARVAQFTAAVGGTGQGLYQQGSEAVVGGQPGSIELGDIDGDGDLDLLATNYSSSTVSICLNGGDATGSASGTFSNGSTVGVGNLPLGLALGDVDGDGDLDLLTANNIASGTVSVRLNGGNALGTNTGTFSNGSDVPVGNSPTHVALGDIDGDGDLDLVAVNQGTGLNNTGNTVSVRLNGGSANGSATGIFSNGSDLAVGTNTLQDLALGDVDGDGDLDLLVTAAGENKVYIRLNGGDATGSNAGTFSNGSFVATGFYPANVVLGDVDGDGDLDLLTANYYYNNSVSVRLNGGDATGSNTGTFSNGTDVPVGMLPRSVALGDVDGDGDLDILTANYNGTTNTVTMRLNGGDASGSNTGTFSNGNTTPVGYYPISVVLGDVDGDGDLDLVTANYGAGTGNTASVRLNGGTQLLATQEPQTALPTGLVVLPTVLTGSSLHYAYTGPSLGTEAVLGIYSLTGQRMWEQVTGVAATGTLPAVGLASGWYLVRLHTVNSSYTTRFFQP